MKLAALIPTTSRGSQLDIHKTLVKAGQNLQSSTSDSVNIRVYLGIDEDDDILRQLESDGDLKRAFGSVFAKVEVFPVSSQTCFKCYYSV